MHFIIIIKYEKMKLTFKNTYEKIKLDELRRDNIENYRKTS